MTKRIAVILFNLGDPSSPKAVQPFELDIEYKEIVEKLEIFEYHLVTTVGTMSEFFSVMAQLVRGFLSKIINIYSSPRLIARIFLIGYSLYPVKLLQGNYYGNYRNCFCLD